MNGVQGSSVSVVMAVYNGTAYLKEQLSSVLRELHDGDELIIVDDCSKDGSRELVAQLTEGDPRVVVTPNKVNLGVRLTFERGLSYAKNPVVFLCDQDDVWLTGKRDAFVSIFDREPDVMIVLSDAQIIDGRGTIVEQSFMATRGGFRGDVLQTLVKNCYLGCAMAFRRSVLAVALPIPALVPMHDMWFGVIGRALGKTHYLSKPYLQYRRHGANVSPERRQGMLQMIRWRVALSWAFLGRLAARNLRPAKE